MGRLGLMLLLVCGLSPTPWRGRMAPAPFPPTLTELAHELGIGTDPRWGKVEVMSWAFSCRRRIYYSMDVVLDVAVRGLEAGHGVVYPAGTWFWVEELKPDGTIHETHVMRCRGDMKWEPAVYDDHGHLGTLPPAKDPGEEDHGCIHCHYSPGRMTPFKYYPEAAPAIGQFRPEVFVKLTPAEKEIVKKVDLSLPRVDRIEGCYAGLAALQLARQVVSTGSVPAWAESLWPRLLRQVPELPH